MPLFRKNPQLQLDKLCHTCKYLLTQLLEATKNRIDPTRSTSRSNSKTGDLQARKGTERKPDFLPLIAEAFVEKGFRRTTTAQLAERCQVRENELYRIWPNKKSMFLDSIRFVFDHVVAQWKSGIDLEAEATAAEQLIANQARQRGDSRLHRVIFTGLGEVDDPEIRKALKNLYQQFHKVISGYVRDHREKLRQDSDKLKSGVLEFSLSDEDTAWAMIGLGSIFDIQHELGVGTMARRREMLGESISSLLNSTKQGKKNS